MNRRIFLCNSLRLAIGAVAAVAMPGVTAPLALEVPEALGTWSITYHADRIAWLVVLEWCDQEGRSWVTGEFCRVMIDGSMKPDLRTTVECCAVAMRRRQRQVLGLDHLEGETVEVLSDGPA